MRLNIRLARNLVSGPAEIFGRLRLILDDSCPRQDLENGSRGAAKKGSAGRQPRTSSVHEKPKSWRGGRYEPDFAPVCIRKSLPPVRGSPCSSDRVPGARATGSIIPPLRGLLYPLDVPAIQHGRRQPLPEMSRSRSVTSFFQEGGLSSLNALVSSNPISNIQFRSTTFPRRLHRVTSAMPFPGDRSPIPSLHRRGTRRRRRGRRTGPVRSPGRPPLPTRPRARRRHRTPPCRDRGVGRDES